MTYLWYDYDFGNHYYPNSTSIKNSLKSTHNVINNKINIKDNNNDKNIKDNNNDKNIHANNNNNYNKNTEKKNSK